MFSLNHRLIEPFKSFLQHLFSLAFLHLFVTFNLLLSANIAYCLDRSFAWDANIEPDLAGYYIYYKTGASGAPYNGTGADEGNSPIQIPIASLSDPTNPKYTIHDLSDTETYFFVITAYDIYDNESGYSNELNKLNESLNPNLVFTPVTSCRIVDTNLAGGAIPPGGIRGYNVWGNVASQGGNSSGCPSPKDEPYAVHINVTVLPSGNGNIVAYPFASSTPKASLIVYRSDAQNIANSGTVKTRFNCDKDINIKSRVGTAHVVVDVLGYYFRKP